MFKVLDLSYAIEEYVRKNQVSSIVQSTGDDIIDITPVLQSQFFNLCIKCIKKIDDITYIKYTYINYKYRHIIIII